jgi:hypothetical protein
MAALKAGKWTYTEEELDRMFKEADRRGEEAMKTEPRATRATYDAPARRLKIELLSGCVFIVPVDLMQGLRGASDEDLADFKLMPRGMDLHWGKLDAQFTVAGLLAGRFGTKKWMAKLQRAWSRSPSQAKRAPAQANGKKARRPRTKTMNAKLRRKAA